MNRDGAEWFCRKAFAAAARRLLGQPTMGMVTRHRPPRRDLRRAWSTSRRLAADLTIELWFRRKEQAIADELKDRMFKEPGPSAKLCKPEMRPHGNRRERGRLS